MIFFDNEMIRKRVSNDSLVKNAPFSFIFQNCHHSNWVKFFLIFVIFWNQLVLALKF